MWRGADTARRSRSLRSAALMGRRTGETLHNLLQHSTVAKSGGQLVLLYTNFLYVDDITQYFRQIFMNCLNCQLAQAPTNRSSPD